MKIAMCVSEAVPFAKTGGLADVAGALPLALEKQAQEVVVFLPDYKEIRKNSGKLKAEGALRYSIIGKNIKVYFIENDEYFNREGLYGGESGDYEDNLERFSYFCKKTLSLLKEINFIPDIVHCHDWQTALIPAYLKTIYANDSFYKHSKTLLTIHNLGYQGLFPREDFSVTGLDESLFNIEMLEFFGKLNLLKGGIVFSDFINTVSPTYSEEIQGAELGFGLEGVLVKRKEVLCGILNGIDYSIWNPKTDKIIVNNFSPSDPSGKRKNKENLQEICNLPKKPQLPLFGMVTRLVDHKGLDILVPELEKICRMGLQMVILGLGENKYHKILSGVAKKYPSSLSLHLKFDDSLAHKIYAGSDCFLMPSKYEPCGLGQLISLRYGSIPLVYKTGGLADTVTPEHGFVLEYYKKDDLVKLIKEAVNTFANKEKWNQLVKNAFACDFSWEESAKKYVQLYKRAKSSG